MTDGTFLGAQPVKGIPSTVRSSQEHALGLWPAVDSYIASLDEISRVYLVGAGGSLSGLHAAQYLLESRSGTPVTAVNSDEFYHRASPGVGPEALVIALSAEGMTAETVRAASWARERGATVAAVTLNAEGDLARAVSTPFVAQAGDGSQMLLQLLALALLKREGQDVSAELAALRALPAAAETAVLAFEPYAAKIAENMKGVPVTYLIASGSLQGMGSTFTGCFLQEMQWMHAATLNANEFFQGPFEVFDRETKALLYLPEDETRPLAERADRFLEKHSGETFRIDSRELELPGIPEGMRALVAPLVFYTLAFRLAAHYAAVRGYSLEGRRYMWQFAY